MRVVYSLAHDTEADFPRDGDAAMDDSHAALTSAILKNTGIRVTHTLRQAVEKSASVVARSLSLSPPASPRTPRSPHSLRSLGRLRPRAATRVPAAPILRARSHTPPSPLSPDCKCSPTVPPVACTLGAFGKRRAPQAPPALRPALLRPDYDFDGLPMPPPTPSVRSSTVSAMRGPLDSLLLPPQRGMRVPPPLRLSTSRSFTALPYVPETDAAWERWGRRERWSGLGGRENGMKNESGFAARVKEVEIEEDMTRDDR